jgi:glycosyltransferase involved in cell wall biosynthesis
MHLVVVSHKLSWPSEESPTGYVTDGGFPVQIEALSELFASTELLVPCMTSGTVSGLSPLKGRRLSVNALGVPKGKGIRRKLDMLRWGVQNGPVIWRAVRAADAIHTPIPGDVGTVGMIFALLMNKRLFVRHCGNWLAPRTVAEKLWKWSMERFASSRNVMLATGGSIESPSKRNPNVRWIFSTSLLEEQLVNGVPHDPPVDGKLRLVIACRQEERKGTEVVLAAMPSILETFPEATLDVVGDGSLLSALVNKANEIGLGDRVTFHGKVSQGEVVSLLKGAHVFCYPTSASEGFPKVVLEALASGLPVVTTRVSVLPQLLDSGCGILIDEASAAVLAAAVREICLDENKYRSMSSAAITTAQQYSLEKWRDTIGDALRNAWNVDMRTQQPLRPGRHAQP